MTLSDARHRTNDCYTETRRRTTRASPSSPLAASSQGRASNFNAVARSAAALFESWNSLGVSFGARRRTLRALHAMASRDDAEDALLATMGEMKSKLDGMLCLVRREMAAVRRCDTLLREQAPTSNHEQQLPTLVSVLRRVLPPCFSHLKSRLEGLGCLRNSSFSKYKKT